MERDWQAAYQTWLTRVDLLDRGELAVLDEGEIRERFGASLAFGTAGMRGEVGMGPNRMNVYTVRRATAGLAAYVKSLEGGAERGVVISYDTRRCSKLFASSAAKTLAACGVNVHLFEGVRPVPVCSFAIRHLGAAAGIMITASHNPKEYNGYKVYGADGAQMAEEGTARVVAEIEKFDYFALPGSEPGADLSHPRIHIIGKETDEAYYQAVLSLSLSPELAKREGKNIKLVYTPIHGTGYLPVTEVLSRMGITPAIVKEQAEPDTEFSTVRVPNPENADTLALGMKLGDQTGADVVLGTDPDCDRMGVAVRDEKGKFVTLSGNQIGVLLFDYIVTRKKERGELPKNAALVKTIVTTTLADRIAEDNGVTVFNVLTGFKYIGEKIKEWESSGAYSYLFGYEESYGSLAGTHARDKDAVVACMLLSEATLYLREKNLTLYDRLQQIFRSYGYYIEQNVSILYKGLDGMAQMKRAMAGLRARKIERLGGLEVESTADYLVSRKVYRDGREEALTLPKTDALYYQLSERRFVCVRPSGTEPKLKVYVLVFEETKEGAEALAERIMGEMKEILEEVK